MIPPDDIRAADVRIAPHVRRTPVVELVGSAFGLDYSVALKLERLQHTGSFKPRGAFSNLLSRAVPDHAIAGAQRLFWRCLRILAEPGGATALAALTSGACRPAPGERVAVLVCGGNPSPDPLQGYGCHHGPWHGPLPARMWH